MFLSIRKATNEAIIRVKLHIVRTCCWFVRTIWIQANVSK